MGPLAFKDDEHVNFGGLAVKEGDWVFARAQDGSLLELNGVPMRLYRDVDILGTLDDPDAIW
jgi:co-chaperonin GroES (HSP10)